MNNAGVDATGCFDIEITVDAASDKYDNVKVIWNIQQFFMQLRKKVYHHIEITKKRTKYIRIPEHQESHWQYAALAWMHFVVLFKWQQKFINHNVYL